jgi:hypothetical protein
MSPEQQTVVALSGIVGVLVGYILGLLLIANLTCGYRERIRDELLRAYRELLLSQKGIRVNDHIMKNDTFKT